MREVALRVASEKQVATGDLLAPQVMAGAAEDLGELLRPHCDAPWTFVRRVRWEEGPNQLLQFLVDSETVLDDKVG